MLKSYIVMLGVTLTLGHSLLLAQGTGLSTGTSTLGTGTTTLGSGSSVGASTGAAAKTDEIKPLSSSDQHFIIEVGEVCQLVFKLGDNLQNLRQRVPGGDPPFENLIGGLRNELTPLWTPVVDLAQKHNMEGKKIPQELTKKDAEKIGKLNGVKLEKWREEYLDIYLKEMKSSSRTFEAAAKNIQDPELKKLGESIAFTMKKHSETLEVAYKEEKKMKREKEQPKKP